MSRYHLGLIEKADPVGAGRCHREPIGSREPPLTANRASDRGTWRDRGSQSRGVSFVLTAAFVARGEARSRVVASVEAETSI